MLEIVGACVSSIVAFVLPFVCYTQLRHGHHPTFLRRIRTTPGICAILGVCLALGATLIVARNLGWLSWAGWPPTEKYLDKGGDCRESHGAGNDAAGS